ncbi:helix-turn-helix domain-containing protein [Zavarzinia compransoris]|uniref:helix-turn-helix domain-containing protein n=1 Tax=Zavarzinia marina TaxID=2911065 RepID=UPI001F3CF665|nr:helix-turn-helix domain-containing protein [Zavarzinia marina]MCF4167667.1 helix-turn-helix domain-containing protein [Zavarzinia marina]
MTYMRATDSDPSIGEAPHWSPELGSRIKAVIDQLGGSTKAASLVGVTYEQVSKWRDGKARAPFSALAALARAAGRSLDWLAYGDGATPARPIPAASVLDAELMGRVYEVIVRTHEAEGAPLAAIDAGRLAAEYYEQVVASVDGPDEWQPALKMLAAQLRKAIRRAADTAGAGSAKP